MTSAILAALIAAATSLIVSTVVAFRLERMKRSVALEDDDTRKALEFLGKSVEVLQEYRDKLAMIAAAPPGSLSIESAIALLGESTDSFSTFYKSVLPIAPHLIAKQTHDVKNILFSVSSKVTDELRLHGFTAALSALALRERENLRDCLLMLVDARIEIRVRGVTR
jgi:hypothetical protein